jgi:glycosidase
VDFGYDVSDHCDIDPTFGDLAEFDRLVAAAHRRGLKVVLDWVVNHTSDRHPWFRARRDFYVWRDPAPDGGPPNNWVSVFGGSAWTFDASSGQYYLHSFHAGQPDLDWRNPEVEAAMFDVLRFWLARGVDGFRIDAPEFIGKDPALRDNPRRARHQPHRRGVLRPYDAFDHVHDKDHPDLHGVLRRMRAVVDAWPDRMTVGEVRIRDRDRWAAYFGAADEMHLVFDFSPLKSPFEATALRRAVEATRAALPSGCSPALVLGNHDEPRICTRYGHAGARLAAVLLCTLPGTPCLYYGDELGMFDVEVPPDATRDPQAAIDPTMSRDPCRSPMPWTPTGGFCDPGVEPWLPMGDNLGHRSVEMQRGDPRSMFELYRTLLGVRRRRPALHRGTYERHPATDDVLWIYERRHGDDRVIVALHFGDVPRALPSALARCPVLATTAHDLEDAAILGPRSAVLLDATQ